MKESDLACSITVDTVIDSVSQAKKTFFPFHFASNFSPFPTCAVTVQASFPATTTTVTAYIAHDYTPKLFVSISL
jgi:hypothetical protein